MFEFILTRHTKNTLDSRALYRKCGFNRLRPVQEAALQPIARGSNCLIIAPTSGGKTEAALIPVLAKHASKQKGVSILYLAPMRALINDLEPRLSKIARHAGVSLCKWHSEVDKSLKRDFIRAPAHILLTTPESLEGFLLFRHLWTTQHFAHIHTVIIDELHAYAGGDRGAHLLALLHRLRATITGDYQCIGLSATVGAPKILLAAVSNGSKRKQQLVCVADSATNARVQIRFAEKERVYRTILNSLQNNAKHLIFSENRQTVECVGSRLRESGAPALVSHSSLPALHRVHAEKTFAATSHQSMVATRVLEMGIDIGDLEHVIQINAPGTVSSYTQRLGRAGRRPGLKKEFSFICRHPMAVLQATALAALQQEGYAEPVRPLRKAAHLFVQQVLSMAFSPSSLSVSKVLAFTQKAVPFSKLTKSQLSDIIAYMQRNNYLAPGSRLKIGHKGNEVFGGRRKSTLCSDFTTSIEYDVLHQTQTIGKLDAIFVFGKEEGRFRFTLGAKRWLAITIDHRRRLIWAQPVKDSFDSVWTGRSTPLSYRICQRMHHILTSDFHSPHWQPSAAYAIERLKSQYPFLSPNQIVLIPDRRKKWHLYTFAGGKANAFIAALLTYQSKLHTTHSEIDIVFSATGAVSAIINALHDLRKQNWATQYRSVLPLLPLPQNVSKFEQCLPPHIQRIAFTEQLFDTRNAACILSCKLKIATPCTASTGPPHSEHSQLV